MKFDVLSPGSSHRLVLNMSGSTSTASHRLTPLHHQDSRLGDYVFVPRLKVCLKQAYLRLDQRDKACASVFNNPPQHLNLPIHIMVHRILLALHLLALILMLRARFRPNTVQSKPQTLGTLGSGLTTPLLPLTTSKTSHSGSFGDTTSRSRSRLCLVARRTPSTCFWTALVYRASGLARCLVQRPRSDRPISSLSAADGRVPLVAVEVLGACWSGCLESWRQYGRLL